MLKRMVIPGIAVVLATLSIAVVTSARTAAAIGVPHAAVVKTGFLATQQHRSPRSFPITATRLALARGYSGPQNQLATRNAKRKAPCPNVYSIDAYRSDGFNSGIWDWTCTCACVPTSLDPAIAVTTNYSLAGLKCTACTPIVVGGTTATSNIVGRYSAKWQSLSELNGIESVPLGVAEDLSGNIYVTQNVGVSEVLMFPPGSSNASQTFIDSNLSSVYWVAVDKRRDIFVDGLKGSALEVDELPAGSTKFTALPITGQMPGGLAIDRRQNLWVSDQGNGVSGTISEYPPPYQKMKTGFKYAGDNTGIVVNATGTLLGAANNYIQSSQTYSSPVIYNIPAGTIRSSGTGNPGELYAALFG